MGKNLKLVGIGIMGVIGLMGVMAPKVMASSYGNCETGWGCLRVKKMAGAKPGQEWGLESGDFGSFFHGSFGSQMKIILEEDEETTDKEKLMGLMTAIKTYQEDSEVSSENKQKMINALKKIGKIRFESKHSGGLVLDDELYAALKAQMFDRTGKKGLKVERTDVANDLDITGLNVENMKSLINRTDGYLLVKKVYAKTIKTDTYEKADLILNQFLEGLAGVSTNTGWPYIAVDAGIALDGNASSDMMKVKTPWRPYPHNIWTVTVKKVEKVNSKLLAAHVSQLTRENILAAWDITFKDGKGDITLNLDMNNDYYAAEMTIKVPTGTEATFETGNYFVYNRHGDNTTSKIEGASYDVATKTLKFKSLRFSEFAVTNKEINLGTTPPAPVTPPVTPPSTPSVADPTHTSGDGSNITNKTTPNKNIGAPDTSTGEKDPINNNDLVAVIVESLLTICLAAVLNFASKKQ